MSERTNPELQSEWFGFFPKRTKEELYFEALANEYHERAEVLDRMVCSLTDSKGIAFPSTGTERRAVARNSVEVINDIIRRESGDGLFRYKLRLAIYHVG